MTPPSTNPLEVSHAGAGTGTVTGADGSSSVGGNSIDCWDHDMCEGVYSSSDSVTLTAIPTSSNNSSFTGWSGGGCTGTGTCTVPMSQAQDVTATFSLPGAGGTTPTATALNSSANPSITGQQVTYTATVTPVPDGGTVAFTDNGTTMTGCGAVSVNTTSGQAKCSTTYNSTGSDTIVATYGGDTAFGKSSNQITQTINASSGAQQTTTVLGAAPNPAPQNQQVTYTATITPNPNGGGSVDFTDDGTTIPGCGAVAPNTLNGEATCAWTYSSAGAHAIVATYSGDTNYLNSSDSLTENVSGAGTTTALTSSVNPSITGQQVTFTATVGPTPDGGSVKFTVNGGPANCGTNGVVAVSTSTGKASCPETIGSAGSYTIKAAYQGDTNYAASSTTLTQHVGYGTITGVTSSGNPSTAGHSVTFTATVSPTPDAGSVKFTVNGSPASCGTSGVVGVTSGHASCPHTFASAGSYTVKAQYLGDAGYGASSGQMTQTVDAGTQYPLPVIQGLYTYSPIAASNTEVEADFRTQGDPNVTCTMSIARSVFGVDPPFDAGMLVPLPALSPNGGNPFPCAPGSPNIVDLAAAASYAHHFSGLSPLTTYDVSFSITNAAGTASQVTQFTVPAEVAPASGGGVNATVNVPPTAAGGTATGNTSASGSCISIVNGRIIFSNDPVCAAPVRARWIKLGKVVVKDLKPGSLTLHIKASKKVRKAARKAHKHHLRAKLTIVIHGKSGKVVDKMTQKVRLRF